MCCTRWSRRSCMRPSRPASFWSGLQPLRQPAQGAGLHHGMRCCTYPPAWPSPLSAGAARASSRRSTPGGSTPRLRATCWRRCRSARFGEGGWGGPGGRQSNRDAGAGSLAAPAGGVLQAGGAHAGAGWLQRLPCRHATACRRAARGCPTRSRRWAAAFAAASASACRPLATALLHDPAASDALPAPAPCPPLPDHRPVPGAPEGGGGRNPAPAAGQVLGWAGQGGRRPAVCSGVDPLPPLARTCPHLPRCS